MALIAAATGCYSLVDPQLPEGAEPFTPPAVYARWWSMTEACSGLHGQLNAVSWYQVPGVSLVRLKSSQVKGYWSAASNQIVLAGNTSLSGGNVRHEMLHALLRSNGHPRTSFLTDCGGVVDCGQACIADAGPAASDALAVTVFPDSLEISIAVEPSVPTSVLDGGFFTLTVSARNAAAHPVAVSLPAQAGGHSTSFSYQLVGASGGRAGGELALDPAVTRFAAGETKRQVFDFRVGLNSASGALLPGTYTVRGAYSTNSATQLVVIRDF